MEQKQRRFTKNVFVLDTDSRTLCGIIAKQNASPYCQIRIGRVIAFKPAKNPEPKGYVLSVSGPGAYRIQDGQDVISLMLTQTGIEATTERWEEWKFESVSATPMATRIQYNGIMVDAEIKYCKGMGIVMPHMRNDFDRAEAPSLPGVMKSHYDIRELRQKIKNERERMPHVQIQSTALKEELRWMDEDEAKIDREVMGGVSQDLRIEKFSVPQKDGFKKVEPGVNWSLDEEHVSEEEEEEVAQTVGRVNDGDSEEGVSEDENPKTHITKEYIEKVSKMMKAKDERFMSLSSAMPQANGNFDRVIVIKKFKWQNVPLFCIDESSKKYELQCVGACERVAFVSRDMSLLTLPIGV
ncbi:NS2 protein [Bluetongue virus]|uniref:Non-structural protein NS2 n=1 Tax=Bluetongue virus TaxID=40051 RepID=A0A1J0F5H5_BTV|nr:NS2 protein [Bluetongue virus]